MINFLFLHCFALTAFSLPLMAIEEESIQQMKRILEARAELQKEVSTHQRVVIRKEELKLLKLSGQNQDLSTKVLMELITEFERQMTGDIAARAEKADFFTKASFLRLKRLHSTYLLDAYPRYQPAHDLVDGLVDYNYRAKRHNEKTKTHSLPYLTLSRETGRLVSISEERIPFGNRREEMQFYFDALDARWEFLETLRRPIHPRNCSDLL